MQSQRSCRHSWISKPCKEGLASAQPYGPTAEPSGRHEVWHRILQGHPGPGRGTSRVVVLQHAGVPACVRHRQSLGPGSRIRLAPPGPRPTTTTATVLLGPTPDPATSTAAVASCSDTPRLVRSATICVARLGRRCGGRRGRGRSSDRVLRRPSGRRGLAVPALNVTPPDSLRSLSFVKPWRQGQQLHLYATHALSCFRASAGRRHMGHFVASRLAPVRIHCSKQAAWKT